MAIPVSARPGHVRASRGRRGSGRAARDRRPSHHRNHRNQSPGKFEMMSSITGAYTRQWPRLLLLAFACAAAPALAQAPQASSLAEGLKSIKRADNACRSDDGGIAGGAGAARPAEARPDLGCAITADAAQALLQKPGTMLFDLRPDVEYQLFRINGALHVTLSDLRSKPYWRDKTAILAGNGKAERELYSACTQLKQLGYKSVHVLRGGTPVWLAAAQPVLGRAPSASQLQRLAASEFWTEAQNGDNLVVLDKSQSAFLNEIAFSVELNDTTALAIRTVLERRRRAMKTSGVSAVVLAAGANVSDQRLEQMQQALLPIPLLVYTGTRESYVAQVAVQKAVWLAHESGPKQLPCGL
ncbi:hypothetical protein F1735_27350 [Massilia sp. CCM 8694]|uniref:Rhodanese domain-containing protein n=2 Tax=Massilia genomosp. 1 TaxID=2609280 RepID=A0ABX0MTA3_9BURK|nr:hypothetical protein [Massilia genomosp. 1]